MNRLVYNVCVTTVYTRDDVESSKIRVFQAFAQVASRCNNRIVITKRNGHSVATRLQGFFNLRFSRDIDRTVYEMILTHGIKAEKMGPGGFDLFAEMLLLGEEDEKKLNLQTLIPKRFDVTWLFDEFMPNGSPAVSDMVKTALDLVGFGGKIVIEESITHRSSVELVQGYTFAVGPAISMESQRLLKPRVAAIDGFVETVSEIHTLLEDVSECKEPLLLFTRGMADDVKSTLHVNKLRGTLLVVPVIVPFDLEGMNTLVDIATVSGGDVVSSNKGELMTSLRLKQFPKVQLADVYSDRILIKNRSTSKRVAAHLSSVKSKRDSAEDDSIARLYDRRIRSLSAKHAIIRLPKGNEYVLNSQAIDHFLRAYSSLVRKGTVQYGNRKMLADTVAAAKLCSNACREQLERLGAVIQCS